MTTADPSSSALVNVLGLRDFRALIACRFGGAFCQRMVMVALGWHIYDITSDPLALGYVGLALFLPAVILILPAGDFADRYERRFILCATYALQAVGAVLLTALTLADAQQIWLYYVVLVLFGAAGAFGRPSNQSFIANVVPRALLPNALAWGSMSGRGATIFGPAFGGLLYLLGPWVVFATAAALYLGVVALMSTVRQVEREYVRGESAVSAFSRLFAGLAYIRSWPIVMGAITLDLCAMILGGATAMLPVYARDILHIGPDGLGLLRGAPAIGSAVTAIVLAHMPMKRHAGPVMFGAIVVYGVATIAFGLSDMLLLSLPALAIMGAADMVSTNIRSTMIQLATPDGMRGRVSAVNALSSGASNELGDFESGLVASWVGAPASVVIGGAGCIAVVAAWMWAFPPLRRVDRLAELKPTGAA